MTALASGTQRQQVSEPDFDSAPIADNVVIFQNSGVMVDSTGYLHPGGALANAYGVGVAIARDFDLDRYDNTVAGHTAGAMQVKFEAGVFGFANDSGSPVLSTTRPGTKLYFLDDNTLSLSSSSGTRAPAGRLYKYDAAAPRPVFCMMSKEIGAQILAEDSVNALAAAIAALTALTDNSGGATADGTIGAVTAPTALTDSTGGTPATTLAAITSPTAVTNNSGGSTADTTLAVVTLPTLASWDGAHDPSAAEATQIITACTALKDAVAKLAVLGNADAAAIILLKNDAAQFAASQAQNRTAFTALTDAVKELSTKINAIIAAA